MIPCYSHVIPYVTLVGFLLLRELYLASPATWDLLPIAFGQVQQ